MKKTLQRLHTNSNTDYVKVNKHSNCLRLYAYVLSVKTSRVKVYLCPVMIAILHSKLICVVIIIYFLYLGVVIQ